MEGAKHIDYVDTQYNNVLLWSSMIIKEGHNLHSPISVIKVHRSLNEGIQSQEFKMNGSDVNVTRAMRL